MKLLPYRTGPSRVVIVTVADFRSYGVVLYRTERISVDQPGSLVFSALPTYLVRALVYVQGASPSYYYVLRTRDANHGFFSGEIKHLYVIITLKRGNMLFLAIYCP